MAKKQTKKTEYPEVEKRLNKARVSVYFDVEELLEKSGLSPWEAAGFKQFTHWEEGKQVTEQEFSQALDKFKNRTQGGGSL